eukprot:m.13069 g.13069  ORF g.13069 m.13069 type:complete len:376 (+) comp5897_c0_seq2:219-1346(+)
MARPAKDTAKTTTTQSQPLLVTMSHWIPFLVLVVSLAVHHQQLATIDERLVALETTLSTQAIELNSLRTALQQATSDAQRTMTDGKATGKETKNGEQDVERGLEQISQASSFEPDSRTIKSSAPTVDTQTIHFVYGLWDKDPMPPQFQATISAWERVNPSWTTKVWTEKDIKELWKSEFPELKYLWKKALPIQRADIARLMIVLVYGGLYADLDCSPTKPIDEAFEAAGFRFVQHNTVLCLEDDKTPEQSAGTARWPIRKGVPEYHRRVANYVFWAKPRSEVIEAALSLAVKRVNETPKEMYHVRGRPDLNNPYAIIYTTGPDVLTEVTFPQENGRNPESSTLVVGKGKCHMSNKATGTWIGDQHPAWGQKKSNA